MGKVVIRTRSFVRPPSGSATTQAPDTHADLASSLESFIDDRRARGLSPRTVQYYRDELRYWHAYVQEHAIASVLALKPADLRGYLLHLAERRNAGGQHAAYRALRAFLRWFGDEEEPPEWRNPIDKVRPPKRPKELLAPVELADVRRLLSTCEAGTGSGVRDRALLLCLLDTGCRASEFVALNVGDVDLENGATRVQCGKGGKGRLVFLSDTARAALHDYLEQREAISPESPLWVTLEDTRLSYAGLRQILRRRADRAGIRTPSLHSFRRAFAIGCLRAGMDVYSLKALMGHADLSVLQRYLAQTPDDLQRAHREHGPLRDLPAAA